MLNIFKNPKSKKREVIKREVVKQDETGNTNSDNLLIKQFNGLNIQVYGTYDEPLFKAKDIGDLLGMSNIREVIKNFNNKQDVTSV
jgi:prophage antirepressor-like protein